MGASEVTMTRWITFVGFVSLVGCSTGSTMQRQAPPRIEVAAEKDPLLDAVKDAIGHRNWRLERINVDQGLIEATTPPTKMGDFMQQRERWVFFVDHAQITVTRMVEAQFERGGAWQSRLAHGATYRHVREREELAHIMEHLRSGLVPGARIALR